MRVRRVLVVLAIAPALLAASAWAPLACGGRTELIVDVPIDAAVDSVSPPPDGSIDATVDTTLDAVRDAPADVVDAPVDVPEEPAACTTAADCTSTSYCQVAACDPKIGCTTTPRSCDDGIVCTDDLCDEKHMRCTHQPDDSKCPDTQLCSPTRDCDAFVYGVASDGNLYEVRVPSGTLVTVGTPAAFASDIALTADSTLYATDTYVLYTLDRSDGTSTAVASILPLNMYNGLGTVPPSSLYASADAFDIFSVDRMSGASNIVAPLPSNYRSSGDLTTVSGQLFVTLTPTTTGMTDALATVDLVGQTVTVVGDTGVRCVWGLATLGGTIYGLTCTGAILTIDPMSGASQPLSMVAPAFFGAAGR